MPESKRPVVHDTSGAHCVTGSHIVLWEIMVTLLCLSPLTGWPFGMHEYNDQTHPGPAGSYGISQVIRHSSSLPAPEILWSRVCAGSSAIAVSSIDKPVSDPRMTGLRELWALTNYSISPLPDVWSPDKVVSKTTNFGEFLAFSPGTNGFSIRNFAGRYGLPTRYLTGRWTEGQVAPLEYGVPQPGETLSLQAPDFLIYDLPSGHAVALYVPKPPKGTFITANVIDSEGRLLVPNMVELLLPAPAKQHNSSRKITAGPDGSVTALLENGDKESIGTWAQEHGQLVITTTKINRNAFPGNESVWLDGIEYAMDILVNEHEVICHSMVPRSDKPSRTK